MLLEVTNTGLIGLNELLSGGFPRGRVILLIGGPGTGKTIFAGQFIHKGIEDFDENGIYISLDESKKNSLLKWQLLAGILQKQRKKKNLFS